MSPRKIKVLSLSLLALKTILLFHRQCVSSFSPLSASGMTKKRRQSAISSTSAPAATNKMITARADKIPKPLLIHWKGDDGDSFGSDYRLTELKGALAGVLCIPFGEVILDVTNALNYGGVNLANKPQKNVESFNHAIQYVKSPIYARGAYIRAVERCSLAHALYEVVAESYAFDSLADVALLSDGFDDLKRGMDHSDASWCVRVRHFGESSGSKQDLLRYGGRTRSVTKEKEVCLALKPLLIQFGGKVDLKRPDVKIYIFDGMFHNSDRMVLTRRLANGPQIASIDPNTRICVTNTPLVPTAAYLLCNAACLRQNATILDPYAGSGTILLASAMIEPTCHSVGIEIAHDGLVNRDDIRQDFRIRQLSEPLGLLLGDCTDESVRVAARKVIGGGPFDCIISDPPYGIRESTLEMDPLACLLECIINDRDKGMPMLKTGGMLACFVPCRDDQTLDDVLPSDDLLAKARLRCCAHHEQPLNKKLSRWLVSFVCY
ncbi:hypothetical protein MPSEU_000209000 [Mayamaea pseudoterrestris]|nr:hypothetical protein MPSEU_000209000 [Mayamaea pseudoterrestris]